MRIAIERGPVQQGCYHERDGLRSNGATVRGHQDLTLREAEQNCKEILDWAGLTDSRKMRAAQTEVIFSLGGVYNMAHGGTAAERFGYEPGITMRHSNRPWTKGDVSISETMLTAWTNFAKTGNPGLGWEPYTKENPQYMIFKLDESGRNASAMGLPIDGSNVFHRTPFD